MCDKLSLYCSCPGIIFWPILISAWSHDAKTFWIPKTAQRTTHKHLKSWREMMWLKHDVHSWTWCRGTTTKQQNWTSNWYTNILGSWKVIIFPETFTVTCIQLLLPHRSFFLISWWREPQKKTEKAACIFPGAQSAFVWPYACSVWLGWIICMALCKIALSASRPQN